MLKRFLERFKKFKNVLTEKGYTLVEISAVVAVTATLAAVVVPVAMDKISEGKEASALQDCKAIGAAITGFYADTGQWPAYDSASGLNYYSILRSGTDADAVFTGTSDDPVNDTGASNWAGNIDNLENHLVRDNPGGTLGQTSNKYKEAKLNWKGPYSESLTKKDPWGNNYLVFVEAMYTQAPETESYPEYGWVISAGPDSKLQTDTTENQIDGDDIGVMVTATHGKN